MPTKLQTGFTLVELIIVVAIISILASIAIPAYNGYVETSKRSDAQASLMALAIAQEKYRASNPKYGSLSAAVNESAAVNDLSGYGVTALSKSEYYSLASSPVSGSEGKEFTATATAKFKDEEGAEISINQDGPSGTLSCWGKN